MLDALFEELQKYVTEDGNLTDRGRQLIDRLGAFWDNCTRMMRERMEKEQLEHEGEMQVKGPTMMVQSSGLLCPKCTDMMPMVFGHPATPKEAILGGRILQCVNKECAARFTLKGQVITTKSGRMLVQDELLEIEESWEPEPEDMGGEGKSK